MKHDTWHIQLFGPLCARRGYAVHTRFRTRQTGELLACLAIFPDRVARREELIELLWPGCTQETGRNNLRMALSSLRGILDPREGRPLHEDMITLLTDRTYAQLNPAAYTTDKSEFETILRSAPRLSEQTEQADALQAALRLYSSELLPDYQAQWIVDERRRLSDAHLLAMRRLVVLLFKLREFPVAFDYAHRAISIDPLREESHYMLLQLYVGTGQAAAAARHYQEMEAHLYAEVGLKPSARTRALMEQSDGKEESGSASMSARTLTTQATGMSFPSAPLPPISPRRHLQRRPLPLPNSPLFGREDELADVCAMIHTPQTRLVTLTGLGGSGKTRLALALAEQLQEEFDGAVWFVRLESLQEEAVHNCRG